MKRYNPKEIEPKWRERWEQDQLYQVGESSNQPKHYILEYFPYPSGSAMHVGHVRNYTIGDVYSRYCRMKGMAVLHPMGWDAFGLPAENYAIKTGISPKQAIAENTKQFKQQLEQMGFSYDWSREINSTDPSYYRWTQWFFLLLYKRGLAYQKESLQWWCPIDKTVLANEQVENGKCWRCGSDVEKKALKQWFFKITAYADRLLYDLDNLDWSDAIKTMQRNWIGRSSGAEVIFKIEGGDQLIQVYTTRPDTLSGATFLVLAPEHTLVEKITTDGQRGEVNSYIKQAVARSDIERQETKREKTGVFSGAYAINPINNSKMPIWIADYVLMNYGTGAIMGVPAHDKRDNDFAKEYKLPIVNVIDPVVIRNDVIDEKQFVKSNKIVAIVENDNKEVLTINWGPERGGRLLVGGTTQNLENPTETALREVTEETGYKDLEVIEVGEEIYHYKYFAFSKNEAHSCDTKFVHIRLKSYDCQPQKLDESEVNKFSVEWILFEQAAREIIDPMHLYAVVRFILGERYEGEGVLVNSGKYDGLSSSEARERIVNDLAKVEIAKETINYKMRDWLISRQRYWGAPIPIIHCPKDGIVPVPDKDLPVVLPDLTDFQPRDDGQSPLANDPTFIKTTCPQCGGPAERETDTMDGFACSSWYFLRFADPHNDQAPFARDKVDYWLPVDDYIGGAEHAVMHLLYARFWTKVIFDEGLINFQEPFTKLHNHGMILAPDGSKMSKSKNNTIEPDSLISQGYGADSIRLLELFIGPWNQMAAWSTEGLGGTYHFLQRIWTLCQEYIEVPAESNNDEKFTNEIQRIMHRTIKLVSEDMPRFGFNTAIASLMEAVNNLYKLKAQDNFSHRQDWAKAIDQLLKLIAPFAPFISEELWQDLGHEESIHRTNWPDWDKNFLSETSVTVIVQVNGKLRAELQMQLPTDKEAVIKAASEHEKIIPYLKDQSINKTIYVPERIINFVIKPKS